MEQRKAYWCYVWNSKLNNSLSGSVGMASVNVDRGSNWSSTPILVEKMMDHAELPALIHG